MEGGRSAGSGAVRVWIVAYLLWFFFGVFGLHRLYLRRVISGNLYMATLGIFGIGWLADSILTAFLVRGYLSEAKSGRLGFERETFADIEGLERGDRASAPRREAEPNIATEILDFLGSSLVFIVASLALARLFIHFDLVLLSFPIAVVWIVLLINPRKIDMLKDNLFLIKDLPINVENTLSATVFKNFHFRKGYRISAAKYIVYPFYLLAYPFLAKRMDAKKSELAELAMFFRLYTGIFLFWLSIELSRYFSVSASLGVGAFESLICLHPLGFLIGILRDWYPAQHLSKLLPESVLLLAALIYLVQISNSLIVRNQFDLTVSRTDRGFAPLFRIIVICSIAGFSLIGFSAIFSPRAQEFIEGFSARKFASAVDYAYTEPGLISLLEEHILARENQGGLRRLLEASLTLAGADGRSYALSEAWRSQQAEQTKLLSYDAQRLFEQRYQGYFKLYPVLFDDAQGKRHCYIVYALDDLGHGVALRHKIYPLYILEAEIMDSAESASEADLALRLSAPRRIRPYLRRRGGREEAKAKASLPRSPEAKKEDKAFGTSASNGGLAGLGADLGNALFKKELEEGFRRVFLDRGLGKVDFELRMEAFLSAGSRGAQR